MATIKGRNTNPESGNGSLKRRGEGLGTGPVGSGKRPGATRPGSASGRSGASTPGAPYRPRQDRAGSTPSTGPFEQIYGRNSGKGSGFHFRTVLIVIAVAVVLFGGGSGIFSCLNGGIGGDPANNGNSGIGSLIQQYAPAVVSGVLGNEASGSDLVSTIANLGISSLFGTGPGSASGDAGSSNTKWSGDKNVGKLDTSVAKGARKKYTEILGDGKDTVTVLVYMIGSDLESKYGMASADLKEMTAATLGSNVNLLVITGGSKAWKSSAISASDWMIFSIRNGSMTKLLQKKASDSMTNPQLLQEFISYGNKHYPADRNMLIFWDHGGGSVSGYGYDENFKNSKPMTLQDIDDAMSKAGVQFDLVGFDACLMGTAETAFMLKSHADYLIASEEAEPGVGWYYTDFLTALGKDPSMPTIELGKMICDDFVETCESAAPGQSTTLSLIDLAEFEKTVPEAFTAFANETAGKIDSDYAAVSTARAGSREFAASSGVDQIDLVHFAKNLGSESANRLVKALLGAVKYNRVSRDMTNSYGLSVYFPYRSAKNVDEAVETMDAIGMEGAYGACIKRFAQLEVSGQIATGGTAGAVSNLFNMLSGAGNTGENAGMNASAIGEILSGFVGSGASSIPLSSIHNVISGLSGRNADFIANKSVNADEIAAKLEGNLFDDSKLNWYQEGDKLFITLTKEDWALVNEVVLSMWYDDGEGYIDLGCDNIFTFDDRGNFIAEEKPSWLQVNGTFAAYYMTSRSFDGEYYAIRGYIPALLNGERVELLVLFDNAHPSGTIVGAATDYHDGEMELVAKNVTALKDGDVIDFIADYYDYDGNYQDSFMIGEQITVKGAPVLKNVYVDEGCANMMYRFTDIYGQVHWTPCFTN